MIFEENKVYTSLNADELKVGSKVLVSNSLGVLRSMVNIESSNFYKIAAIASDDNERRFITGLGMENEKLWAFAYLIEEPIIPYKNKEEAFINLAGVHWLQRKENGDFVQILNLCENHVCLIEDGLITEVPYSTLLEDYEVYNFSGENSPCGVLEK